MIDSVIGSMSPYVWPLVIVSFLLFILALNTVVRERVSQESLAFLLLSLVVVTWMLPWIAVFSTDDQQTALSWIKVSNLGLIFLPTAFYLFTMSIVRTIQRKRLFIWITCGSSGLFCLLAVTTDWFMRGLQRYSWGYYPQYGHLGSVYLVFLIVVMLFSYFAYRKAYKKAPSVTAQNRFRDFSAAFGIACFGMVDLLPACGVSIYPVGYLAVFGFTIIAATAIRRYRLVDIATSFTVDHILTTVTDALIVVDKEGVIRVVNKAACNLLNRSADAIVGIAISHCRLVCIAVEGLEALILEGGSKVYEASLPAESGGICELGVSASVMNDHTGKPVAVIYLARDITAKKEAEEKLRRVNSELRRKEKTLEDLIDDLRRSNEELWSAQLEWIRAAKLESVGRLAAGVAHEIKNGLGAIEMGMAYLGPRVEPLGKEMTEVVKQIDFASKQVTSVVRGLLAFSSPRELEETAENINLVLEEALGLIAHEIMRERVHVLRELDNNLPLFNMDKTQVVQVFMNIFLNAIHAMPKEGTLRIRTLSRQGQKDDKRLGSCPGEERKEVVVVEVEDTGTGVPEDKLNKIFDPFFTTKPEGKGTGLGLTVSQTIMETHGGSLHIANREEGGARVTLVFPTVRAGHN
ncbi:MAG: PAS domain S-box protein [Candidatus Omnitrophica bacterium]|nr:PAS domain S-box protein [Candidatus Omnitrophota bacterium]